MVTCGKEHALLECRKLIDVLNIYGNILVPELNGRPTTATERLKHFADYLINNYNMTLEDIDREILKLSTF